MKNLNKFLKNKKVLITGHTGFKGSWLSVLLNSYGASVYGLSLNKRVSRPSHYKYIPSKYFEQEFFENIYNHKKIERIISNIKPEIIFHLAAQSIVSDSYNDPFNTWKTNVLGTVSILNAVKDFDTKITVIMITSDKVYKNNEWVWGYRENDTLWGNDPYSASKSSSENAIYSYLYSFINRNKNIKVGIARAGNVIGGGDWSNNRIIPDCIKSWSNNKQVIIKNPNSIRPWQHVLDPLHGYILMAYGLYFNKIKSGEAFNFGPNDRHSIEVIDLVKVMQKTWRKSSFHVVKDSNFSENKLLSLNSDKAKEILGWSTLWLSHESIQLTAEWYYKFYERKYDIIDLTLTDIKKYRAIYESR